MPSTPFKMKPWFSWGLIQVVSLVYLTAGLDRKTVAQSIVPAADGTGTVVTIEGNQITISGGQRSVDGSNLFESLTRFGLDQNQIATFLAQPGVQNILTRVVGGDPSIIHGLIQVSGSPANLVLLNPAGILFGPTATLNVPASFTATTADRVHFSGGGWFSAFGNNPYSLLTGNPDGFGFSSSQPGSIVNAGNLQVGQGQSLILLGGTVVSTGKLTAPDGQVIVSSIPGQQWVRLGQAGSPLSLEVLPPSNLPITPLSLPQLLTAGGGQHATGLQINNQGDVELLGSGLAVRSGDLVVSNLAAGQATLAAAQTLTIPAGTLQTTGNLLLQAEDAVRIRDSSTTPFLAWTGGDLTIQGKQQIDIFTLSHPITSFQSGGKLSLSSNGLISGDAHFVSGKGFFVQTLSGAPGEFVSFYDPIVSSAGDVSFGSYTGTALKVEAMGSITVNGNITITTSDGILFSFCNAPNPCSADAQILIQEPALILRAGVTSLVEPAFGYAPTTPASLYTTFPTAPIETLGTVFSSSGKSTLATITVTGAIDTSDLNNNAPAGRVILEAPGNITTNDIKSFRQDASGFTSNSKGGSVQIQSTTGSVQTGNIGTYASFSGASDDPIGGAVTINAAENIIVGSINTTAFATSISGNLTGGAVSLTAGRSVTVNGSIRTTASTPSNGATATAGAISLKTTLPASTLAFDNLEANGIATRGTGRGGSIALSSGLIRGTGTGNTVQAIGQGTTQIAGSLAIQHDGGSNNLAFTINDATITATNGNGFRGGIDLSPAPTLTSGSFPVLPSGGTVTPASGIRITSINSPPAVTLTIPPVAVGGLPLRLVVGTDIQVTDPDLDGTQIVVDTIASGSLTRNGIPLTSGTVLNLGDVLFYTPDPTASGTITAFSLKVADINNGSFSPAPLSAITQPIVLTVLSDLSQSGVLTANVTPAAELVLPPLSQNEELLVDPGITEQETEFTEAFQTALELQGDRPLQGLREIRQTLTQIRELTGEKPALIYLNFAPARSASVSAKEIKKSETAPKPSLLNQSQESSLFMPLVEYYSKQEDDPLEVTLITEQGAIRKRVPGATRAKVMQQVQKFRTDVSNNRNLNYQKSGPLLYRWFIATLEPELKKQQVNHLAFILDRGLHSVPLAALYDGQTHLVEKYGVAIMPSFSLTDTRYRSIKDAEVLAMGASRFQGNLADLPAVPIELAAIAKKFKEGRSFLNQDFTLQNLKSQRQQQAFRVIHLATHGEFQPGRPINSFIQLWDTQLRMPQIRQLNWNNPSVDLLVLSACRTALGDEQAELGFAGLAVQAGVKTALASLWYISDEGALAFMNEFYTQLPQSRTKVSALRSTQLSLLQGKVRRQSGQLISPTEAISLPPALVNGEDQLFTHPFYWAAFAMIGNPW